MQIRTPGIWSGHDPRPSKEASGSKSQPVLHPTHMAVVSATWQQHQNHVLFVYAQLTSGGFCIYVEDPKVGSFKSTKPLVDSVKEYEGGC